jgi:hypothetical protein
MVQRALEINFTEWPRTEANRRAGFFACALIICAAGSALLASWLPLQVSLVTLFLFAGPHNWFELRYFLLRLPVRFGRSRAFFLTAFAGIFSLSVTYLSLPLIYKFDLWQGVDWSVPIAIWNTLMLVWLGALVWLRGKLKPKSDWFWGIPAAFFLVALNWLAPELFSLAIVYVHPLIALWFLDRHLRRTKPEWLRAYHLCLCILPILVAVMCWRLASTSALPDDNGLFWRITQHAGARLLPGVSSHLLVSVHLLLEMLHYGVWIIALPLIGSTGRFWDIKNVPLARHPRGFPQAVAAALIAGLVLAGLLWFGFSVDYATTRDVYFTVAIAHVLAEAPFLLRMI